MVQENENLAQLLGDRRWRVPFGLSKLENPRLSKFS